MTETPVLSIRSWIREALLGYAFWCLFQGLAPIIWFFPLNELELSGYEAFAVCLLSPCILGITAFKRFFSQRYSMALLRLIAIAGLGSFQCPSTISRLIVLCAGLASSLIVLAASITSKNQLKRHTTAWGLILGLLTFVSVRVWFLSFVPTWWNDTWNSITVAFGIIATIDKIASGEDSEPKSNEKDVYNRNCLIMGCGLGTMLFQTQLLLGESSILSRWTIKEYPDPGPQPFPHGALIIFTLLIGVFLIWNGIFRRSKLACIVYTISFFILYYFPRTTGFSAGLLVILYTFLVWPEILDDLTTSRAASTFVIGAIVYLIEIFFSVWTVAYNFVPGGVFTRERTHVLIGIMTATLSLYVLTGKDQKKNNSPAMILNAKGSRGTTKHASSSLMIICILLLLFGFGGFFYRLPNQEFNHPPKEHPNANFTAAIWTYHFGYDNRGWPSLERTKTLFDKIDADFITLLESDASKTFLGNNDLGLWLSEKMGMYVDFGPSTKDHTWGNLILSRYPIVKSKHHLLPSPEGELAPAITATVNMSGNFIDFVVTHMGNDRDVLDRKLQAEVLSKELKKATNPVVFLGYVTSAPQSREYLQLIEKGNVKDIDSTDMDRWCEYIMYRGLRRLGYARISNGGLSDTEIQVAKFQIPESKNFKDNDKLITNPSKIERINRFNPSFGEFSHGHNWIVDHRYHMSTPKYFLP
ncbi:DgyrCDS10884 [Dimorphilus gyrociliatus]|uniref:PGAP2-interacting protein n=1 Tax=Dimorphilus gyrociliatus TaxID=2664684 RepID=A0A7I8W2S9_9ANNE|nr:DgyrCDS10884 [Dimorphilus gyrociliatus]